MFKTARLKLTAWYLLIAMLISVSFSVVIYQATATELDRFATAQRFRIEHRFLTDDALIPQPLPDLELINETKGRFLFILLAINGGIIVFAGGLGYFLAGRALKPISEMLDEQNQFISDSSHELRTPLTSLKSALEVNLRDKNLTLNNAKILLTESVEEVNKLQSLSDSLLELAQHERPNRHSKFEKISLSDIVLKAIRQVSPLATKKNVTISNLTIDTQLSGHKLGLINLLVILLDNAIKYSPNQKTITLSSKKLNSVLEIRIQDQGIGVSPADLPHIFDRFYRADTARLKTGAGGYGLGLSIAQKIVNLHHGSIMVASRVNHGSTFTVRLPI